MTIGGTYLEVAARVNLDPDHPEVEPTDVLPSFAIVHPFDFDGTGGVLTIKICAGAAPDPRFVIAVQEAIALWNELTPTTGNCEGCYLWEETVPTGPQYALTTLIHEFGHCVLGLGHNTLVIDKDSFLRDDQKLPGTDSYIASANRGVGDALGFTDTQSVMYSAVAPRTRYTGLAADDVNMVKMGMAGADRDAGTGDDYSIALVYEPNCGLADVRAQVGNEFIDPGNTGALGLCVARVVDSFAQNPVLRFHHTVKPLLGEFQIVVELNGQRSWDFSIATVFADGFESGDTSSWPAVCPPTCAEGDPEPPPPGP